MGNVDRAAQLIDDVRAAGATEFCVCAGSRNSPLLAVLGSTPGVRLFSFVDERSAAFFAIGRSKLHGMPVAVVTTSGTAVAELLPGAVEAFYSGIPLILISADRPARFRATGAPQSIDQVGIFGVYAETDLARWSRERALHINIEFDEPLIDEVVAPRAAAVLPSLSAEPRRIRSAVLPRSHKPLVIVGGLPRHQRDRVRAFVKKLNAPTFAEPLSGLREDPALPLITSGERMIARGQFDSVIRIGSVPTLRFWRDLENLDLPVTHFSELRFAGITRGDTHPIEALPEPEPLNQDADFFAVDREQRQRFEAILDQEPESELAMVREVSRGIASGTRVYLGNSLPIREWDLAAAREQRQIEYDGNRGANGIDGQLSTFFGWCDPSRENVCVVGDLTTIYDLGAPWIVPQLGHDRFRIVVINNGGGRIFSRVASLRAMDPSMRQRIVENAHDFRFEQWASMWGIEVTELRPDADASNRAWRRYDELWA